MEVMSLASYPKPLQYKIRKLTKEEKDLELWKKTYEMVRRNKLKYLDSAIRKVRLSQLLEYIKSQKNKRISRKAKSKSELTSDVDTLRKQWGEARQMGNEYSKMNRYHLFDIPLRKGLKEDEKAALVRESRIRSGRVYGNMCSKINITKLRLARWQGRRPRTNVDSLTAKRRTLMEYGLYYSARNKLFLKDSFGQFDQEYQDLLLKCVTFEKDHLNVRGFLEEKFYTNLSFQRSILAFAYEEQLRKSLEEKPMIEKKIIKEVIPDIPEKKVKVTEVVQPEKPIVCKENKMAYKEEFPSVTRIRKSTPKINIEVAKPEALLNTVKYNITDNKAQDTPTEQSQSQEDDEASKELKEKHESFVSVSDAVLENPSFEDSVLDIIRCYESADADSRQMENLLSDLFLAFGLNLVKTSVGDNVKKEVDMDAIKSKAAQQAEAISQVLNEVFRNK